MVDRIVGGAELLLSEDELELYDLQVQAQKMATVSKADADYQNEPKGDQRCEVCKYFVEGFPGEAGGYCSKVTSFRGPLGTIFPDGWCRFFDDVESEQ